MAIIDLKLDEDAQCVDCKTTIPGRLNMNAGTPIGIAWCCPLCATKYPSLEALDARLKGVSMPRYHDLLERRG